MPERNLRESKARPTHKHSSLRDHVRKAPESHIPQSKILEIRGLQLIDFAGAQPRQQQSSSIAIQLPVALIEMMMWPPFLRKY